MFSGKTTELFRRIKRYTAAHENCLVVRYDKDNRYSSLHASTHDREMLKATGAASLAQIADLVEQYDVIGVDEGQFYPDIVEMTELFASQGKKVVISALDGDFRRKPFGRVLELVPMAESVTKLTAVCTFCHADAPFTRRITTETAIEVIGGADKLRTIVLLFAYLTINIQVCCLVPKLLFQSNRPTALGKDGFAR